MHTRDVRPILVGVRLEAAAGLHVCGIGDSVNLPPALAWIDGFSVGIPELDEDHRQLVADAGAIVEAVRERRAWREVEALAGLMVERCRAHFRREEMVLERDRFAALAAHRGEHARIDREMQGILGRIGGSEPPTVDMIDAALSLREMLVDHLLRYDLAYKSHGMYRRGR